MLFHLYHLAFPGLQEMVDLAKNLFPKFSVRNPEGPTKKITVLKFLVWQK